VTSKSRARDFGLGRKAMVGVSRVVRTR